MTIDDRIQRFLADELRQRGEGGLTRGSRLIDDGILDSLSLMHLITFLEESFGIEIGPEEVVPENFETIGDIASLVRGQQRHAAGTGTPGEPDGR
jgi:acyl carrier protein